MHSVHSFLKLDTVRFNGKSNIHTDWSRHERLDANEILATIHMKGWLYESHCKKNLSRPITSRQQLKSRYTSLKYDNYSSIPVLLER